VAQLVAHFHGMEGVRGSNPLSSTKHEMALTSENAGQGHLAPRKSDSFRAWEVAMLDQLPGTHCGSGALGSTRVH
jgi:hypothetical protein